MSYTATVLKVMIGSPGDLADERQIAEKIIFDWNAVNSQRLGQVLLPVRWETHASPALDARAQGIINRQIVTDSDMLVAMFWTRIGTPTGEAPSGTVEEIEEFVRTRKPVMLYFSNKPIRPGLVDAEQYKALLAFKNSTKGLVEEYDSLDEFKDKFTRQLTQTIFSSFPSGDVAHKAPRRSSAATARQERGAAEAPRQRPPSADSDLLHKLSDAAADLLIQASKDRNGVVLANDHAVRGFSVQTHEQTFVERGNPRSEARGRRILRDLVDLGMLRLRQQDDQGEVFEVTDDGFRVADQLSANREKYETEALSLVLRLRATLGELPREESTGKQVRSVTLWPEGDPASLRTLAASFGPTRATLGADVQRHLTTIAELARALQQTSGGFDWSRWSNELGEAERALVSLADAIDPNWRAPV